jgi:hypothetical protein
MIYTKAEASILPQKDGNLFSASLYQTSLFKMSIPFFLFSVAVSSDLEFAFNVSTDRPDKSTNHNYLSLTLYQIQHLQQNILPK